MGTIRWPLTLALRSATLAGYSALLAGAVAVYVDVILGALTGHTWQMFGALWLFAMAVSGVVTGVAAAFGSVVSMGLTEFLVVIGNARRSRGPPAAFGLLFDIHRNRAAGLRYLVVAQCLLLRRQRRADAAGHDGDLGSCGLFARNRRHRFARELSCHL